MRRPALRLLTVQFFDGHPVTDGKGQRLYDDCDGEAFYEIHVPCADTPRCETVCTEPVCASARLRGEAFHHHYERQLFASKAKGGQHQLKGATEEDIEGDRANVWEWDGSRDAPTLTPSFLGVERDRKGRTVRPFRVHLYLTKGRIDLLSDSTVTLLRSGG